MAFQKRRFFFDAGFILAIGILIAISLMTHQYERKTVEYDNWVRHTNIVLQRFDKYLSTLLDAETGQRYFIITGKNEYLKSYYQARKKTDIQLTELKYLTRDNLSQQYRLDSISVLNEKKLAELNASMVLREKEGLESAMKAISANIGRATIDVIHKKVIGAQLEEMSLLNQRTKLKEEFSRKFYLFSVFGGLFSLLLLILIFILLKKENRTKRAAEKELRKHEEHLASLVEDRTNELQASRQQWITTLSSIGEAVIATDEKGSITFINPVAENLTGWSQKDAIGQKAEKIFNIINERTSSKVESPIEKVIREGKVVELSNHSLLISKDGKQIPIDNNAAPIKTETGETKGVVLVFRDLSLNRKTEEELRKSERRYSALFSNKINGIAHCRILTDEKGDPNNYRILQINEAYERIIGVKKADIEDHLVTDVFPDIRNYSLDYIGIYGKIALENGEAHFEDFFEATGQYLSIYAYSPVPGEFIAIFTDVTERKKAEAEVKKSEERFRSTLDHMIEGAQIIDFDWRFIYINDVADQHNRRPKEELLGKHYKDMWPGIETTPVFGIIRDCMENRVYHSIENEFVFPDGSIGWFDLRIEPIPEGIFILSVDISDRKRAEEDLRQSEANFKQLANAIPQLAWMAKAEGYIYWYNDRWYEYTGTTPEQTLGWGWQSVHDPIILPTIMKKWEASLQTGEPFEMVFPLKNRDGVFRDFLTRSIPIKNHEGKVLQWFGTNTDISQIKEAEKKLKEAQEKLDLVLDNGHVGIWERDLNSNSLIFDKRMERMFGYDEGTFEKTYEAFEKKLVDEDIPHVREAIKRAFEECEPIDTIYRIKLTGGKIKYINSKGFVIEKENGKAIKIAGVCFDITDMKEGAERAMFLLNEELLRSNKELEQFAYIASHDLQEPLRTVSSFTQLLAKRYKDKLDENAHRFIHYTLEAVERMQVLINDLLNYSRIGTKGKVFSDVDFNQILSKALENLTTSIQNKKALVTFDKLPSTMGDPGQLIQLMQNLIGNALKFCKTNPVIHISVKKEPEFYRFSIKDNGIGIEQEYSDKIFLIFQRLVGKEEYEGSGIGLAVCKRIVERHGGKIFFESTPGKGTTFYFTIPIKKL
jgi:PAS domain S-box-containing protein